MWNPSQLHGHLLRDLSLTLQFVKVADHRDFKLHLHFTDRYHFQVCEKCFH